jgi:aminoglycoside phosphotransferase (APT) family kinase protein
VGRSIGQLPQNDLIHLDFHHRNILQGPDDALIVIDLEGCQPGDRAFDLVTFAMYLDYAQAPTDGVDRVWRGATGVTNPEALRAYVAHMALRRLDWTIRFHPDDLEATYVVIRDFMARVGEGTALRH